jgi:serine/threonine protein kinase
MIPPGPINSSAPRRGSQASPSANLCRAWQDGQAPDLPTFVAELSEVSPAELAALIRIDFAARWNQDDRPRPEEYFGLFSAVASDVELAVDIIYAEYLAREQSGEGPQLAEYQQRFPAFAQVLAEQIRLHQAIETLDDNPQIGLTEPKLIDGYSIEPDVEASYEILEQIGSGGMGVVYKARQPALNRFVALKMMRAIDADNPELLARFRSEARVVAALHHPHIVQVYDVGEHGGLPYITMELIPKGSLAERLDGTPWDPQIAAVLIAKLATAVQFAHEHHVIHRDLKPANVLVVSDDKELEVKVTDFGLAKFLVEDSSPHTKSFTFLGTPSYMAPEQATGRPRDIGPAADIYALGAILYELLTGQPPIRGESPIETLRLLLSSEPVSIHHFERRIPRDLATICEKCIQREINKRYSSAADLQADLERFLEGKPIRARPISKAERAWRWCRRNPLLAGALGSVTMLLLGIAGVSLWYSAMLSREITKTRAAEQAEREANQTAQQRLWNVYLGEAAARNASHQVGQRFAALESVDRAIALLDKVGRNSERERRIRNAVLSAVALPDVRPIRVIGKASANLYGCAMSVAADCYVVATHDGTFTGRRLSDNRQLWTIANLEPRTAPILSRDGRIAVAVGSSGAKVWRVDESEPRLAWEAPGTQFFTFAPDGEHACYSDPDGMRLVRVSDGNPVRTIGKGAARSRFAYHVGTNRIAVCGADSMQVITADTGEVEVEFPVGNIAEPLLAWHTSG